MIDEFDTAADSTIDQSRFRTPDRPIPPRAPLAPLRSRRLHHNVDASSETQREDEAGRNRTRSPQRAHHDAMFQTPQTQQTRQRTPPTPRRGRRQVDMEVEVATPDSESEREGGDRRNGDPPGLIRVPGAEVLGVEPHVPAAEPLGVDSGPGRRGHGTDANG